MAAVMNADDGDASMLSREFAPILPAPRFAGHENTIGR
jgi:hypothetical protein